MQAWYAIDAKYGDKEIHGIYTWIELQVILREILQYGSLQYIEVDETDRPQGK
jgi:hypothetical protein